MALFKDGELVWFLPRHRIEGRDALAVAQELRAADAIPQQTLDDAEAASATARAALAQAQAQLESATQQQAASRSQVDAARAAADRARSDLARARELAATQVVSVQALGNNLMATNDTTVFNTSFIFAPLYRGQAYNLTYVVPLNAWRLDGTLRYYTQHDTQDERQTRLAPSLKVAYRWFDRLSVELEGGREQFDETGPIRETHSTRWYVYGGYRLDFQ